MPQLENPQFNVVLVEPEIPTNTGNIGRTCVGMNSRLHLVGKLGFDIDDRSVKRAGLDYWSDLDLVLHESFATWLSTVPDPQRVFFYTTKVEKPHYSVSYKRGDYLVFGKETKGLDASILEQFNSQCVTVPFVGPIRSFNLSNTVSIALSEGMRQLSQ